MKKQVNQTHTAMQFFGFRYPPFSDTFDITIPYCSEFETCMLHRILAMLRQGKSIALCGDAGTGKSMFVKTITNELDSKQYRIAYLPYGGMKPSMLLRDLCDEFDIDTAGRKGMITRLVNDFGRESNKPFPIIIVDEAHEMQKQSFLDLCALLHDPRSRTAAAALILVGQPRLKKMLELDIYTSVRTRLAWMGTTHQLSADDAKDFITFRLEKAGAKTSIFQEEALECLAADSKGNRRMLMNFAALCLEEAAQRKDRVITADIVNAIILEYQT